jgi:soluble lytic murein transglycosylase
MKHKKFIRWSFLACLVLSSSVPVVVSSSTEQLNAVLANEETNESDNDSTKEGALIETPATVAVSPPATAFSIGKLFSVTSPEQKTAFLEAERLLAKHDEEGFLAQLQQLKDYPLYPYLQAQWLQKHLDETTEIEQFLKRYKDTRYADNLRREWLYMLAKTGQWLRFKQYYQAADSHKTALQCYFLWAQYTTPDKDHDNQQALVTAKELWLHSKTSVPACDNLFAALMQSPLFSTDTVWQRFSFSLRGKKANVALASGIKKLLPAAEQKMAAFWLKIHHHPELIVQPLWDMQHPKAGEIFAHGVAKLADNNLAAAINLWDSRKAEFIINQEPVDYLEQKLGLALAAEGNLSSAYHRLIQVNHLDEKARQVLIRTALREQNWSHIGQALDKLTAEEKNEDKWRYWQARAWAETGKAEQAKEAFTQLAKKSNFYAFLAADKINQPYQVVNIPVPVTEGELQALQQQDTFKIVAEWQAIGRKEEAMRQWWYAVKKSTPKQIMVAAKLAQSWQMPKLAAFTIAKAEYWQDLELRFPMAYLQEVNQQATVQNLDPSIVLGLIRQESVFDEMAGSQVGARGLMQIMPATGRQIARQLEEPWHSDMSLYEPETNIKYGTFYFKQLLDKFNGQVALAAAGYNAGPGRVKNWRPDRPMAMDIWIETIPFNETRQYVSIVLSNTLFYQQRMNRNVLKIADFMTDVQPSLVKAEQLSLNANSLPRSRAD